MTDLIKKPYSIEAMENKEALNKLAPQAHKEFLKELKEFPEKFKNSELIRTNWLKALIKEGCKIIDIFTPSNVTERITTDDPFIKFIVSATGGTEEILFMYEGELYSLVYNQFSQMADLCKEVIFKGRIERSKDVNERDSSDYDMITHGFSLKENPKAILEIAKTLKFDYDVEEILVKGESCNG